MLVDMFIVCVLLFDVLIVLSWEYWTKGPHSQIPVFARTGSARGSWSVALIWGENFEKVYSMHVTHL